MPSQKDASQTSGFSCNKSKNKKFAQRFGRSIRIGIRDYRLVFCDVLVDDTGTQIAGCCDTRNKCIYVDVTHEVEATLLHEIVHGVMHESGFGQRPDWDQGVEEQCAETLSQAMAHAFKFTKR